jgi:hypothetical protein
MPYLCRRKNAGVAQLVEHDLAKVRVAGPSPVSRSGTYKYLNYCFAGVAQLVEHDLAKVRVAGPSPVSRSWSPGGGTGRRAGLKIQWPLRPCRFDSGPGYYMGEKGRLRK